MILIAGAGHMTEDIKWGGGGGGGGGGGYLGIYQL